ncbi:MAG: hypothetical protein ACXWQO_19645 [Bdellovibrionota bacterium]
MYGRKSERVGHAPLRSTHKNKRKKCNLCYRGFYPQTGFDRYCHLCKEENELLRFGDWLPRIDESVITRFSA